MPTKRVNDLSINRFERSGQNNNVLANTSGPSGDVNVKNGRAEKRGQDSKVHNPSRSSDQKDDIDQKEKTKGKKVGKVKRPHGQVDIMVERI